MKNLLLIVFCGFSFICHAQEAIYSANIKTPQLFVAGNQLGYPVIRLNSADQLELHFDDLDADVKSYSYTFQLYNADWTPAELSAFDFIKGFSQIRISDYRLSSIALTKYTHYQAIFPDRNCIPIRSGNYILKVFLNGDTTQLAFTKRFLVVDNSANIAAQFLQPMNPDVSRSHQKIQLKVNTRALNVSSAFDQVKVWILQNNRWDNAIHDIQPSFFSGNILEYNSDDAFVFPGGNEWRWLDLQGSFHYQSERVLKGNYGNTSTELFIRPDGDRSRAPYYYYKDYNGLFYLQTTESIDPFWQTDYATVRFTYVPADHIPFPDKDVYIFGRLTGYALNDSTKMIFNADKGVYQSSLFLKQGYYNYAYVTVDRNNQNQTTSFEFSEGNHVETENDYTILVYYRQLGGRADELVGITKLNTLTTTR
jgi:type 9 secretion system plug protein